MKAKKIPMRQCVGCHGSMAKSELIRVIKTPEGDILIDATGITDKKRFICYNVDS